MVAAGVGDVDAVLQPLAGLDHAHAAGRARVVEADHVDPARAVVVSAGVLRVGIVVRRALVADVEVLGLDRGVAGDVGRVTGGLPVRSLGLRGGSRLGRGRGGGLAAQGLPDGVIEVNAGVAPLRRRIVHLRAAALEDRGDLGVGELGVDLAEDHCRAGDLRGRPARAHAGVDVDVLLAADVVVGEADLVAGGEEVERPRRAG